MTLGQLDATMGAWELGLWVAKAEIEHLVEDKKRRNKGLSDSQALDMVRADHRSVLRRKGK